MYGIGIMAHDLLFVVTNIYRRLEYFHFQVGYLHPFQPSDQFFRFSTEHTAADHFNPASPLTF